MLLEALNIKKMYGDRVIIDIDKIQIHDNERIGIVGKNGAGKTTLLNILTKNIKPDEGIVRNLGSIAYITQMDEGIENTKSGGEKTILKIREAFSKRAQLLFADEPTSNLDTNKISWVENEFKKYKGAIVLISHDRGLLDNLCTKIWDVEEGKLQEYRGNYSSYIHQKEERLECQKHKYEQYINEKIRLEESIKDRKERASKIKKAPSRMGNSESRLHKYKKSIKQTKLQNASKSIESRLEKLTKVEKPKEYKNVKFDILESNKIHSKIIIDTTVYSETIVRTILARLLFNGHDINKKVEILSGGERVKVAFAKIFLSDINMLVIDEPTNYLDIESIEALEDLLIDYEGTVLFVSHDRNFVKKVADKVIIIENEELKDKDKINKGIVSFAEEKEEILKLEFKISETISRLSMPSPKEDIEKLDREYKYLLNRLNEIRNKIK
ncbi:ATP-binding cassette domain-containing protein [Hathewaya histolytica]|uniref:ABC transporter ATP-binding protein n=1 Tax=Hathewaya histolytica TaxID=1498 RepID=A0A4U9R433_HATHI|nr:ATP-binding cassette domain-containing protein [Hathewaya histolytica]VTQ85378.1 ABC transporter ATP-binding protein [Hathewaya histolytica]